MYVSKIKMNKVEKYDRVTVCNQNLLRVGSREDYNEHGVRERQEDPVVHLS